MSRYKNRIIAISFFFVIFLITVLALIILNSNNLIVYAETKYEDNIYSNATLEDDFEDDSVLIVLDKSVSNFNGISKTIEESLYANGAISIKDLTALPNTYLNKNGKIDVKKATILSEYYSDNAFNQILKITLNSKSKQNVLNCVDKISKLTGVMYAEPNMSVSYGAATTNDANLSYQWGLVGNNGIHIKDAWNITTGSSTVRVGVVDSGIAYHDDLKGNVVSGYDFYNHNAFTSEDICGHGTHVAGIIGAYGNNSLGISGVAQRVSLVPLQTAYDQTGPGWHHTEDLIEAITYARDTWGTAQKIPILNYSIAGYGQDIAILSAAKNFPGLFVWSAGNNCENADYYAKSVSFNVPNIISVGSIDSDGTRSLFSNYGINSVHIYAPGGNIYSTLPNNSYGYMSGTSMAAPHVTGVAALLLSKEPKLTASELRSVILSSADDITISTPDGTQTVKKLNAYNALEMLNYNVILDNQTGQGGDGGVKVAFGEDMPTAEAPTRTGYTFKGYYSQPNGDGDQYYGPDMESIRTWDKNERTILYAHWEANTYKVTLHSEGNTTENTVISVTYGEPLPELFAPKKYGYAFDGYYDENGKKYYGMEVKNDEQTAQINAVDYAYIETAVPVSGMVWDKPMDTTLYGRWDTTPFECDYTYFAYCDSEYIGGGTTHLTHGASKISPASIDGYNFNHFSYRGTDYSADDYIPVRLYRGISGNFYLDGVLKAYYDKACVAQGSMITLADGSQVAVENLTGNEMLLVWNLYTGTYDTAPILFIDSDPLQLYKVINLSFSDGTTVKVISEHGFWDYNLNKYVYLDGNAADYIGHWFNKGATKVQLTGVEIADEYTTPYSPVTYGHLCYYVNGMLSMPGGIGGLFNIFDVDAEALRYDEAAMAADIEQYGLFTYEEFAELVPVSEEVFDAFNGRYLKVAIGKGLTDTDRLAALAERYQEFFV